MTGPLSNGFYRLNKGYKEFSDIAIGTMYDPYKDIVLITGGSNGLGHELAKVFKAAGGPVVVLDNHIPEEKNPNYIKDVKYLKCDVSDRKKVFECAKYVTEKIGNVTILINNAGITTGKAVLDLTFDEIEQTISVNLLSNFYTIKAFLPKMLEIKRGYIVTVASTLGYMSPARLSVYGASKSGLIALHESLTYELGPPSINTTGVKTLLVCPGQLKTGMFSSIHTPSTILAPELDPADVAFSIYKAVELGKRGEIKLPFYGNFLPVFRSVPWPIVEIARYFSGIDATMAKFKGNMNVTASITNNSESANNSSSGDEAEPHI